MVRLPLGRTGIEVSPVGIGTWAWGERLWGYGRTYTDKDLEDAFHAAISADITFFDTAEVYGWGRSERLLGQFLARVQAPAASTAPPGAHGQLVQRPPVVVATKFMPFPWRLSRFALLRALRSSLRRLGLEQVDLYQVHWPFPPVPVETWMDAMAEAVQAGLVRAVGVSNYSAAQMRRAYEALARRGVVLASNQVEYSLLHRHPERNGLLAACQELGVTLIAYSPLAQGILTGKYGPERPPAGFRRGRYHSKAFWARARPVLEALRAVAAARGKTPAQVALNWVMARGAIPIPGAKNARQAQENAGALGWRLTEEELASLDEAAGEPVPGAVPGPPGGTG